LASWCCGALVSLLQGALASLLPCPSRIAAAVRNLHRRYRAALAWLLLWHSRTAAAASVALLHASLLLWRSRVAAAVRLLHS